MVFAAKTRLLCPMLVPLHATCCQLWPGAPRTKAAVPNSMVGVCQLTSETSVDPALTSPSFQGSRMSVKMSTSMYFSQSGTLDFLRLSIFCCFGTDSAIFLANSSSSSV